VSSGQSPLVAGPALRSASLADLAHEELHRRIADGALAEGERLIIDRLAREFATSLNPVREALARLHAERLVTFERNKGYRVAPKPSPIELQQLFEARLILEIGAVEQGLRHISEAALAELAEINRNIAKRRYGKTFEGFHEFVRFNEQFHVLLVGLCRNPFIIEAYNHLGYHQRIMHSHHGRGVPDIERIVSEHEAIIETLRGNEPAAVRDAIRRHIMGGATRLGLEPA
jgi:DNA-binding GntR family transcriptional regulator